MPQGLREKIRMYAVTTKLVAVADAFPRKSANKIAAFKKKYGEDRIDCGGQNLWWPRRL
jgi:hypothetical protein